MSEAIKVVHHGTTMEHIALLTQIFLKMDRLDLAQKQLQLMQQADEDATLTQLCTAMVFVATGGAKYQEAVYMYEELIDKFGASQTLLNGLASALMHMGRFDEAEKQLIDAASKGPNDPDTLVNLIALRADEQAGRHHQPVHQPAQDGGAHARVREEPRDDRGRLRPRLHAVRGMSARARSPVRPASRARDSKH